MSGKISLSLQINEVKRELLARRDVYARLVASGKMRQSVADYQTMHMRAVLDTLEWLQLNEAKIKAALGGEQTA